MKRFSLRGFTLIELLIVVAIIAILAAIAVPNFLEAQTRAKVSRVRSDMRSTATALEAYYVDNNRYPAPMDHHNQVNWRAGNAVNTPPFHSRMSSLLTTPLAYMTSLPNDPFRETKQVLTGTLAQYNRRQTYFNFPFFEFNGGFTTSFATGTFGKARALGGDWLMYSPGPDMDEFNRVNITGPTQAIAVYRDYDPTNGTISIGNIFRTQKSGDRIGVDPFFYP